MKTCPSCKSEVSELALRCKYCSSPLPQEEVKRSSTKEKSPLESSKPKGGAGKMFVVGGVGFAAGFLVALLVFPNLNFTKGKVSEGSKKTEEPSLSIASAPSSPKTEEKAGIKSTVEPNFVVVNGKVIPNPKKSPAPLGPAAGEEPAFISVNGKIVPNPKKQQ